MSKRRMICVLLLFSLLLPAAWWSSGEPAPGLPIAAAQEDNSDPQRSEQAVSVEEARGRVRILHETLHGALQVMHRDYFREDEGLVIPSRSLEDVFRELARSHDVQLHWIAVNAQAMHIDHEPRDAFEKAAAAALASGRSEFEQVAEGRYRYVGAIRLASQCLSCHAPSRTSNKPRVAGLVISLPLTTP